MSFFYQLIHTNVAKREPGAKSISDSFAGEGEPYAKGLRVDSNGSWREASFGKSKKPKLPF